jgi:uncharacterized damage-inducible protein DinB
MNLITLFLAELDRETDKSRRALESVPSGKHDWKPHDRSMPFGYLANMVATIPRWLAMEINQDELDVAPKGGSTFKPERLDSSEQYLEALDTAAAEARKALQGSSEEHLLTTWKLLAAGQVVMENPRHVMLRDTINHWVHHRGQMTVYLRLMGAKVPAIYGPSADDQRF